MRRFRYALVALAVVGWIGFDVATDSIGVFVDAQAVSFWSFEQLTVDNTAGGKAFTATKVEPDGTGGSRQADTAVCRLETAEIRYTVDGTAPTTTVGTLLEIGDTLVVSGHDAIMRFRAIRTGGSSGVANCNYSQR